MKALAFALLAFLAWPSVGAAATIVVDTGHTEIAGGSRAANGVPEFRINRSMAEQVIEALVVRGHEVIDPHALGEDGSLLSRVKRTSRADLFISIHHDSIQPHYLKAGRQREFAGFAVFVSAKNVHRDPSLRCSIALGDALIAAGGRPSKYHAEPIKGENRPLLDPARGIHRFDDLVVLKGAQSPAVLLEVGVIVNPDELERLTDPRWVATTAAAIGEAVHRCVGNANR